MSVTMTKGVAPPKPPTAPRRRRLHENFFAVALGCCALIAVFLFAWELAVRLDRLDPVLVGQPTEIGTQLRVLLFEENILSDAAATLLGTAIGWALASVLAIVVAFALATTPYLRAIIEPIFTAMNSLPRIALAPIFLLWFDIGMQSKIALSASLAFFVVLANAWSGIDSVDDDALLLSRTLGANKPQRALKFVVPAALPSIFTGLELGFIFGLLAVVGGEMISGQNGLGVRLQYFASTFQTNQYFATLLVLVVMATAITLLLRRLRLRLLRWQTTQLGRGGVS